MSPILGIIASQNYPRTSYESIATVTVGSGGSATVDFTSIPSTYTHLQIRSLARTDYAGLNASLNFRLNSDTGSNYSYHAVYEGGGVTTIAASNVAFGEAGQVTGATATSTCFGVMVLDILDYANTNKFKTTRSLAGWDSNTSGQVLFYSSNWRSTSAITSIRLSAGAGNFIQYSQFALYGIK